MTNRGNLYALRFFLKLFVQTSSVYRGHNDTLDNEMVRALDILSRLAYIPLIARRTNPGVPIAIKA